MATRWASPVDRIRWGHPVAFRDTLGGLGAVTRRGREEHRAEKEEGRAEAPDRAIRFRVRAWPLPRELTSKESRDHEGAHVRDRPFSPLSTESLSSLGGKSLRAISRSESQTIETNQAARLTGRLAYDRAGPRGLSR